MAFVPLNTGAIKWKVLECIKDQHHTIKGGFFRWTKLEIGEKAPRA